MMDVLEDGDPLYVSVIQYTTVIEMAYAVLTIWESHLEETGEAHSVL